ncbi:28S ribosomal protein S15, mitochondrial [Xylocopa sonorina]|uniref:28S ribosomal protein S15, mitochondrial n=1 Tax=Xylocopa sonorina TaxID=1818115 RepID=UPI00403ADE0D
MNLLTNSCKLMNSRLNNVYTLGGYVSRGAATVEDYKINWKRPPRVPIYDPKKSGDVGLPVTIKPTDFKKYYQNSKEWEDADDLVKKMFSIAFQPGKDFVSLQREKTMELVKRHICDRGSMEVKIALLTSHIPHLLKVIEEHPRNGKVKTILKETVEKRNKYLRILRSYDYRRFEWVLERLNLVYVPEPRKPQMVSRKDSIRRLTKNYCKDIIQKKLDAYRDQLKAEQKVFYLEKAEKLKSIMETEKEYGLEQTVTEEDIEAAQKKAEELLKEETCN